jgi:hypothetical protein
MSVLLTSDTYINGVLTTSGTTVSLGYIPEYNLVYEGSGTWVSIPNVVPNTVANNTFEYDKTTNINLSVENNYVKAIRSFGTKTTPTVPSTAQTLISGTHYYIDSVSGNNINAGTSWDTAWADVTKINSLNPGAGAVIHLAADGVWDYGQSLSAYTASDLFPYNNGDNLNGTVSAPVVLKPYYPRGLSSTMPTIRHYGTTKASDWTLESGYGGMVWSIPWVKASNDYINVVAYFGTDKTVGVAPGQASNGPAVLTGANQYAVSTTKIYVWSASNPVTAYGSVTLGCKSIFNTSWDGMRYFKIQGINFEYCNAMTLSGAANTTNVQTGIEISYCRFYRSHVGFFRNQQTNATTTEMSFAIHDNKLYQVPNSGIRIGTTNGTSGNTVSWEVYRNQVFGGNYSSSAGGALLYNQSIGGTKHIAWGNYGYDCRNGTGGAQIDGSMLYSDVSTNHSIFFGNIAELCGVAFQTNSALDCHIVSNLAIDCIKHTQTTGTSTDNTPNMGCTIAHNTYLWTGRYTRSAIQLGPGLNANTSQPFTQWNSQSGSGRYYSVFTFVNNLAVNTGTAFTIGILHFESAGITTSVIAGNAALGFGGQIVQDTAIDVTKTNHYMALIGTNADLPLWLQYANYGVARPAIDSILVGMGDTLSSGYSDITGNSFTVTPTVGCYEAVV